MAEGIQAFEWQQTGWIAYLIAQTQSKEKLKPETFDLYAASQKLQSTKAAKDAWKTSGPNWF